MQLNLKVLWSVFLEMGKVYFNIPLVLWVDVSYGFMAVQKHQYSTADICVLFIFGPLEKPTY